MTLFELRKEPHLSASAIADYLECGLQYRFSRIDCLRPEFKADSLEFGSCIHLALADFHQERMIGAVMTRQELENRFAYHWRLRAKENTELRFKPDNTYDNLLERGQALLQVYHDHFFEENLTILAIEEPFSFKLKGIPIPIIGAMDLIEEDDRGEIIITDFKTAAKSYTDDDVRKNFQLMVYHLAAKANGYHNRKINLVIECLVKTKTPKFKRYCTTKDHLDERRAYKKIVEVWHGIAQGVFIPNDTSWKCKDCSYRQACADWHEQEEAYGPSAAVK